MGAELPPAVQEQDAESQRSGWPDPLLSKAAPQQLRSPLSPAGTCPVLCHSQGGQDTGREPGCPQAPLRVSGISFLCITGSKLRDPGQVTQPLRPSVASRVEGNNNCEHTGFLED